ncbi:hypothetical protein [Bradyrhizobium icense]|nr:hypothetical protein [Bradyrhizobium icense]
MQTQRIVLALALAIGGGTGAAFPAFSQEYRGTWEQQMACTPDVWRLCGNQIPDVSRIVACLRQNTPQLSTNCRAVFESQANAQPTPPPRGVRQQAVPRSRAPQYVQPQYVQPQTVPPQPRPFFEEDD